MTTSSEPAPKSSRSSSLSPSLLAWAKFAGGGTYAIPNNNVVGEYTYLLLNKKYIDKYNYDPSQFINLTSADTAKYLADIAKYETVPPIIGELPIINTLYWNINFETRGVDYDEFSILGEYYIPTRTMDPIEAVRKEHPAARHTCFAYRLRGGIVRRYSDDGEPQGSAGRPILDVLDRKGVDSALITVTRYFGGILLGTGGLVRAYSSAASSALDDAGLARLVPFAKFSVSIAYPDWQRVSQILRREGAVISETVFGSDVTATFSVRLTDAERILAVIAEDTGGRCRTVPMGEEYLAEPV